MKAPGIQDGTQARKELEIFLYWRIRVYKPNFTKLRDCTFNYTDMGTMSCSLSSGPEIHGGRGMQQGPKYWKVCDQQILSL